MHKFRKYGGQEPPRKLCKLYDFTCLTTDGPRFHQTVEHSRLQGPQELKCALCDYPASKNDTLSKHRSREHSILKYLCIYLESILVKRMYRKHDGLVPKPNHECNLWENTFLIKVPLLSKSHATCVYLPLICHGF